MLSETGGLLVLEATSLLRMVLQKLESVLLERNLKSCAQKRSGERGGTTIEIGGEIESVTYSHEQVLIKILASAVLLVLLLNSASFIQVDALDSERG